MILKDLDKDEDREEYNKQMISEAGMMVGDQVRIREDHTHLVEGDDSNPMDTDGVVVKMYRGMCYILYITVEWDNGTSNWYIPNDLEVIPNLLHKEI